MADNPPGNFSERDGGGFKMRMCGGFAKKTGGGIRANTQAASRVPLVAIGAPWADSMSAQTTQSPLTMPDTRLHALSNSQTHRSVSLLFWGSPYT